MKKLLIVAGAFAAMTLASYVPAKADAYVDSPSFGRIVYGMTGGTVVLPQDAWQGDFPTGASSVALPNDASFAGGSVLVSGQLRYTGDAMGVGKDFVGVGGAGAVNAISVPTVFGNTLSLPKDKVIATKLGFISSYGWNSKIDIYQSPGGSLVNLFGINTNAGTASGAKIVGDPFAFHYRSNDNAVDYYSDNTALNTGNAINQTLNHVKAYYYAPTNKYYIGFEDWNYDTSGLSRKRFDYNDSVIEMSFRAVPEPAFYQMASLLSLGAFGMFRMRRRSVK